MGTDGFGLCAGGGQAAAPGTVEADVTGPPDGNVVLTELGIDVDTPTWERTAPWWDDPHAPMRLAEARPAAIRASARIPVILTLSDDLRASIQWTEPLPALTTADPPPRPGYVALDVDVVSCVRGSALG